MLVGIAALWIIGALGLSALGFIISRIIIVIQGVRSIDKDGLNKQIEESQGTTLKALEQREMPQSYREEHLKEYEESLKEIDFDRDELTDLWEADLKYDFKARCFKFQKKEFERINSIVRRYLYTDKSQTYEQYVVYVMFAFPKLYTQFLGECEIVEKWMHENKMIYTCTNYLLSFMKESIHPKVCEMLQEDIPFPEDFRAARPNTTSKAGLQQIAIGIGRCCFKENLPKEELAQSGTAVGATILVILTILCLIGAFSSGSLFSPLGFIGTIMCFVIYAFIDRRQSIAARALEKLLKQENIPYSIASDLGLFNEKNSYYNDDYVNFQYNYSMTFDEMNKLGDFGFDWKDKKDFERGFQKLPEDKKMYIRYIVKNRAWMRRRLEGIDLS